MTRYRNLDARCVNDLAIKRDYCAQKPLREMVSEASPTDD